MRATSIKKLGRFIAAFGCCKKLSKLSILAKNDQILALMAKILPYQNFFGIYNMIYSKKTIRTTSIPKISKIHSGAWKLKAKNLQNCQFWPKMAKFWPSQNFPGLYTMIFSKKNNITTSIPKISKIYSGAWKLKAKNLQK